VRGRESKTQVLQPYDQVGLQQHKVGSHEGRRLQVERPLYCLEPSPRACRGGGFMT
jgi:hypothetical protein